MIFLKRFKRYTNDFIITGRFNKISQNVLYICITMKYKTSYKLKYFISLNNVDVDVSYYSDYVTDARVAYKNKRKPISLSYLMYEKRIAKYDINGRYPWMF